MSAFPGLPITIVPKSELTLITACQKATAKTSLHILGVTSSTYANATPTPSEEYLKTLSVNLLNAVNTQDFSHPSIRHLAEGISLSQDAGNQTWYAVGKDGVLQGMRALRESMPDYHAEFLDSGAKINEQTGTGTVWLLRLLTGLPDGLRRESVSVLTWERREGMWYLMNHRGIRGIPGGDMYVDNSSEESLMSAE